MKILSVGTALPPHYYDQETLLAAFQAAWQEQHHNAARVEQLHRAVMVGGRHLALPMDAYLEMDGFGATNDAFIEVGTTLGQQAIEAALADAGLSARDLNAIFFTSVTGIAAPSIDARLVNRMGLRPNIKRTPIFGLGCVAGAAGTARLYDYLRAFPDQAAVLLSVELCSLTLQRQDLSIANLIASGLFGDGAAAVIGVGSQHPAAAQRSAGGPTVRATASRFYPDTEHVMGWDVGQGGFKIVLSADVPKMVDAHIRADVDGFLAQHGIRRSDIGCWVAHTGGPKVLTAFQKALELKASDLELTWRSLREVGNLSSASVLFVLRDLITAHRPAPGTPSVMLAMGPGFCAELVLMEW
ncbi:MAG: 3-oxoacyl-[acyl-carrier-protein] synthase III C-terminal domain-containing protein [Myxococcota bacterium]